MGGYIPSNPHREEEPTPRMHKPVTLERLKEEVAAYMREKGMNPWYASHTMELIQIGWERVEETK